MTDETPTRPFAPETERQAAELAAMRRMLVASRGTFSLSIAICNSPALRDYLIERLKSNHDGLEVVHLPDVTEDVYETVSEASLDADRSALLLVNLEKSLPSAAGEYPILRALNATRELWKKDYACPLVLWLPEYAATLLSEHARDLWAWRSHQFEFVSELAEPRAAMTEAFTDRVAAVANLDADRKRFRIAELEQRIAEASDPPPRELAPHVAVWLNELGVLCHVVGELDQAEVAYCKALKISEQLGRLEGMAVSYANLGAVLAMRGDFDGAEPMHRKALEINEKLGLLDGMASDYGSLGNILQGRGDLAGAEQMYHRSLEINEEVGRAEGVAAGYGNLGAVLGMRGDFDGAERMCRKALEIDEKLGRLEGIANSYGNLGIVLWKRGDLDPAEQMHRKALQINEKLGRVEGIASAYGNLGVVYQTRGDLDRAEQMHRKALQIDEKLGRLEGVADQYSNLGLIYETRGDLDRAEQMHRKALEIDEKLGRLEGMGNAYANLGGLHRTREDLKGARECWVKAHELYAKIGMPHMVEQVQGWLDALPDDDAGEPPAP